jgi:hypothetical protein
MSFPAGAYFAKPGLEALKLVIVPKDSTFSQEIVETRPRLLLALPLDMIYVSLGTWLSLLWLFGGPGLPIVNGLRLLHEIDYRRMTAGLPLREAAGRYDPIIGQRCQFAFAPCSSL